MINFKKRLLGNYDVVLINNFSIWFIADKINNTDEIKSILLYLM